MGYYWLERRTNRISFGKSETTDSDRKCFLDTAFVSQVSSGTLLTKEVGPASKWKSIEVDEQLPNGTSSSFYIIGRNQNGAG